MVYQKKDIDFMKKAIAIAKKGLFTSFPNPMVGAVITDGEKILSSGWHHHPGGPHAEIIALKKIRKTKKPLTMYINLEPCVHWGRTGPCVDEIIKSPIKKIFISTKDPNPQVNGKGIEKLKKSNIEVNLGLLSDEAIFLNRIFFFNQIYRMPYVILKWASTLDGYIADKNYKSKWITNEILRKEGKKLREEVDAILVGANTVLRDNPYLDRLEENPPRSPLKKIIIDPNGKVPLNFNLFKKGEVVWILKNGIRKDEKENIKILNFPLKDGLFNLKNILKKLYEFGIYSILVEGGSKTSSIFLKNKLVQEVAFFYSTKLLGNGVKPFADSGLNLNKAIKVNPIFFKKIEDEFYLRGLLCSLESFKELAK